MPEAGDISTVLTLDEFEYMTGLRDASEATRSFANETEAHLGRASHAHGSLHRAQHNAIHLAMAASFAASSGEGEKGMVGQLEKASMLIPMIGTAFGPVGTVIGVTGGLLATQLLGPLKQAQEEAKKFGEALERAGKKWDENITRAGSGVTFERETDRKIDKGDTEGLEKDKQHYEDMIAQKKAELDAAFEKQGALQKAAAPAKHAGESVEDVYRGIARNAVKFSGLNLMMAGQGLDLFDAVAGKPGDGEGQGVEATKGLVETAEQINKLQAELKEAEERAKALDEALGDATGVEKQNKVAEALREQETRRLELAQKIGREVMTPYEKAVEKQNELNDLLDRGVLDDETYNRASKKNREDAAREMETQEKGHGKNAGVQANSGEAYSAVQESLKELRGTTRPEVKLLEQIAENTKKQPRRSDGPLIKPISIPR